MNIFDISRSISSQNCLLWVSFTGRLQGLYRYGLEMKFLEQDEGKTQIFVFLMKDTPGVWMTIKEIDHIALPIENVNEMLFFYKKLGFEISDRFAPDFYSVNLGNNKINFHAPHIWKHGKVLRGLTAVPGCGDVCFVWEGTEDDLIFLLKTIGANIIDGPVNRAGGRNAGRAIGISRYVRDPDSNLLEFIIYYLNFARN